MKGLFCRFRGRGILRPTRIIGGLTGIGRGIGGEGMGRIKGMVGRASVRGRGSSGEGKDRILGSLCRVSTTEGIGSIGTKTGMVRNGRFVELCTTSTSLSKCVTVVKPKWARLTVETGTTIATISTITRICHLVCGRHPPSIRTILRTLTCFWSLQGELKINGLTTILC